jgi:GNAT superfamily N-acetyltransferase
LIPQSFLLKNEYGSRKTGRTLEKIPKILNDQSTAILLFFNGGYMFYIPMDKFSADHTEGRLVGRTLEIREITKLADKTKWMSEFKRNYNGKVVSFDSKIYGIGCRYFVAVLDGKEVGFIRISDYTKIWSNCYDGIIWNASDAYVKTQYRNQHVLRRLLTHVIDHCYVKSAFIEFERFIANYSYYRTLGFTNYLYGRDDWLVYIVQKDLFESVKSQALAQVDSR